MTCDVEKKKKEKKKKKGKKKEKKMTPTPRFTDTLKMKYSCFDSSPFDYEIRKFQLITLLASCRSGCCKSEFQSRNI